jgi:hypothetical protein
MDILIEGSFIDHENNLSLIFGGELFDIQGIMILDNVLIFFAIAAKV